MERADTSGSKRAEADDLRRLAAVVEDATDVALVQDMDGRIVAWSRAAERMYGYTRDEALQLNVAALTPEEERARARGLLEAIGRGEEARVFHPDVVLCDIGLPEMDGYEVARTMRADPELSRIALVAVSGYAQPEDVEMAREAGFDAHLAKPPSVETLERTLAEVGSTRRKDLPEQC